MKGFYRQSRKRRSRAVQWLPIKKRLGVTRRSSKWPLVEAENRPMLENDDPDRITVCRHPQPFQPCQRREPLTRFQ
jgi:hypothetical protein